MKKIDQCECPEGQVVIHSNQGDKIIEKTVSTIGQHNCQYIIARNALIPEAEKISFRMFPLPKKPDIVDWNSDKRIRAFLATMDDLARERIYCLPPRA